MRPPAATTFGVAEATVLRELVRASSGAAVTLRDGEPEIDWASVVHAAERHHLAPLLFEGICAQRNVRPPEPFLARLQNGRNRELANAVVRLHHVDELGAVALRERLDLHLLKGAAFATRLYRDPGLRPMSDIDVLVARSQFERWSRELEELGYSLVDASDHASCFRRRATGILVELHRELTSAASFLELEAGAVLERSLPIDAGEGMRLRTLSWEDHLLHLSLHAAFQHGFRQPGVNAWDARSILDRPDFELEAFIGRARETRLAPWVYGGLAMTAAVFESSRLTSALSALSDSVPRSVVRKAIRFRAERLLSPAREAVFGTPIARLQFRGWSPTTLSLLWEISRPRSPEIHGGPSTRFRRVIQLVKNHGLGILGSTSNAAPALSVGPTPASLGEVRDV